MAATYTGPDQAPNRPNLTKQRSLSLTQEQLDILNAIAREEQRSVSEMIREAVHIWLASREALLDEFKERLRETRKAQGREFVVTSKKRAA